jgi:hypothetical protein
MKRSSHPDRQCCSPAPVIVWARRRLARRCKNGQIDTAEGLAVNSTTVMEALRAGPVLLSSLSQPHDAEPTCVTATLKSP